MTSVMRHVVYVIDKAIDQYLRIVLIILARAGHTEHHLD